MTRPISLNSFGTSRRLGFETGKTIKHKVDPVCYIRGVSQKFPASYIKKHNTAPLTSWCFYVISESFKVLIPWFLQLLYSKRQGKLQHGVFLLSIHLPTLPRCCNVCCGWICLRIISPSTILARSNSLCLLSCFHCWKNTCMAHNFRVTVTCGSVGRCIESRNNPCCSFRRRLEYKSCRNHGISTLKLSEIT